MGTSIGDLPPPFPNAAQSLSRISGDAQLREQVERSSESKPIKTDFPAENASPRTNGAASTVELQGTAPDGNADVATGGAADGANTQSAPRNGSTVDVSV